MGPAEVEQECGLWGVLTPCRACQSNAGAGCTPGAPGQGSGWAARTALLPESQRLLPLLQGHTLGTRVNHSCKLLGKEARSEGARGGAGTVCGVLPTGGTRARKADPGADRQLCPVTSRVPGQGPGNPWLCDSPWPPGSRRESCCLPLSPLVRPSMSLWEDGVWRDGRV